MTKKKPKPPKSRLREKPARGPQPFLLRQEKALARYIDEVAQLSSEAARSHRFSQLLSDLFTDIEAPVITDYLAGLEKQISAQDAQKCIVTRGRPDVLFGNVVLEFEKKFPDHFKQAKRQLQRYVAILRKQNATEEFYFTPIGADGLVFVVFAPEEGELMSGAAIGDEVRLEEVGRFDAKHRSAIDFYYWLDRYFCRRVLREPKAENFVQDFGTQSPAFREASALWLEVIERIRSHSDFKVIYDNWRKYLRTAYGTTVGDESLFVRHTFLATLAKLIAFVRITGAHDPPQEHQTREILEGSFFENQGVLNFLEEDFFSWVARDPVFPVAQRVVHRMATLLFTYNLRELSEDVLKELYQQLVDPKDRHDLGEYYTPDWLAALICEKLLSRQGTEAVLDPSCGSGTFLYQVIQHKKRHLPATRKALQDILGNVVGIDIHPLAVIVAKINVLLALGDLFAKRAGPVSIQVYLANSIRHIRAQTVIGNGGSAAQLVTLNDRDVHIPEAALTTAADLDLAVRLVYQFARARRHEPALRFDDFETYAQREARQLCASGGVIQMLFALSSLLHEFIRKPEDTIWAYILKNQYKPTFLKQQFDLLVGNPPWLSFRFVERGDYQEFLKQMIVRECHLLESAGHLVTHMELGTLFFTYCSKFYLKPQGRIGFVLPRSIFTADQHDFFRRSLTSGNSTFTHVWDLEEVHPLFNVPAAVAFGDLESENPKSLPGLIIAGELPRKNASLEEAKKALRFDKAEFHIVQQGKRSFLSTTRTKISAQRSYYQPFFKEGATIVPRNFWFVQVKTYPGLGLNTRQPYLVTDPRAEAEAKQPYKGTKMEGPIEAEFLYATLLSTDLLPFGHFDLRPVVLPLVEDRHGYELLSSSKARASGFLRLAEWLAEAQQNWERHRKVKAKRGDVLSWLNYRNKLTDQDPQARYVVLYPKSATFLCAVTARLKAISHRVDHHEVPLRRFVADHVTYFCQIRQKEEAHYLTGLLNSPTVDELIKPMQARGLWGPRDIHKKVWELPIPQFREANKRHVRLAQISENCAKQVADMLPAVAQEGSIGRARSAVRRSLKDELAEIDSIVKEILKE